LGGLTNLRIDRIQEPGRYGDGGGLWLQVSQWGTKSWLFRYSAGGKARHMGVGSVTSVSLAEAREIAQAARKQVREGIDPIEARKADRTRNRLASEAVMTFRQAATAALTAREAGWDNAEHRRQWQRTLEQYAFPVLGDLPVADVDTALVIKCLQPIWSSKRTTAERTRGRIEAVFNWATAAGRRQGDNPARWRGHLEHLLSTDKPDAVHHPALPYQEVPAFLRELRHRKGIAARALEFTILTATRTRESIHARWDEVAGDIWTIPAERMKGRKDKRREHRVPLPPPALDLLNCLPRDGDFLFIGSRPGRPLHRKGMAELIETMNVPAVVHGFRSSFKDWASESTAYADDLSEQALAHIDPNKVKAAYKRTDLFEKRRRLMEDWAAFCTSPIASTAEVVPMNAERRRT
jgi:integrase